MLVESWAEGRKISEIFSDVGEGLLPGIASSFYMSVGRPMSCMPGYCEVIKHHIVGFLTIHRASIKRV